MKTFLGLPVLTTAPNLYSFLRHYLSIILFAGLWYFIAAMILGSVEGDVWKYVQSSTHYYKAQALLLLAGVIMGHVSRVLLNLTGDRFYHYPKGDRFFYPAAFMLTWMIINEIRGL